MGAGADDADRPGRRGDRRQDRRRPAGGKEPRRCIPLAGAYDRRPDAGRDAERRRAAERHGRGREDGTARRPGAVGAPRRRARSPLRLVQVRRLPARSTGRGTAPRAQPRAHVRARARVGGGIRPPARAGGRSRAARGAAPLGTRDGPRAGRPATGTCPRRPRARVGSAAARQEGSAPSDPARRRRRFRDAASGA